MKRRVVWSPAARNDLLGIVRYIAADDPNAADRVASKLDRAATALGVIPTGRPGRVTGVYEKSVAGMPYILAYEIEHGLEGEERVAILHVIHQARHWPKGGWPGQ